MPLKAMEQKTPKPLGIQTQSTTLTPGQIPLTTPNGSSIASHTFTQLRHQVPIGYNEEPHIH